MNRRRKRCSDCDKFSYGHDEAVHAALGTTRSVGQPVRIYRCPKNRLVFHLTTDRGKRGRI